MSKQSDLKFWSEKLAACCRQDPKKALMMSVLAAVLLGLWGRMLLSGGDVQPGRAGAATVASAPAKVSGASAKPRIAPAVGANAALRTSSGAQTLGMSIAPRPNDTRRRLREWLAQPVRPIPRNLFTVKLEYFPRDGSRPGMGLKTARDGEFWGRLEKSLLLQADQKDKRENLLANFKEEAGKLRLDSIIMGPQPKAMIDGKLVAEGEVVAAFRVLKIEPRRLIVEREGIRLEIQMK